MPIKAVLFDLDGTLLPMDQDLFVKYYFGSLAKKLAPHGYEAQKLIDETKNSFFEGVKKAKAGNHLHDISNTK